MKKFAVWLSRSLWFGILFDWVVGIPAIFAPEWTLRMLHEQPAPSSAWVAFTSLLLVLLSLFYLPIAAQPSRFPVLARMAAGSRLVQAVFFLWLYPHPYVARGIVNLILFLIQTPLVFLTEKEAPRPGFRGKRAPNLVTINELYDYQGSTPADLPSRN